MAETFTFRHGLREAAGFNIGQRVTMLTETKGDDHDSIEHTLPLGSDGLIECIEQLDAPQGLTFTVWIPVDEAAGRGIVNVFDEGDGPITNFIKEKS
jgi:hypothetical protein